MRIIRRNTFETNSSSTHSISICDKNMMWDTNIVDYLGNTEGDLHIKLGQYDWGWQWVKTPYEKLQYMLTTIASILCVTDIMRDEEFTYEEDLNILYDDHNFKTLLYYVKKNTKFTNIIVDSLDGYIDHDSRVESLYDLVYEAHCDEIEEFIFNPSIMLRQGNDNEIDPDEKYEFWAGNLHEKA